MQKYDVIMTVGNGLTEEWKLPSLVETRIEYIAKLYQQGVAKKILVSGGYSINWDIKGIKPLTTEAREMKRALVRLGVEATNIFVEEKSRDTIGNFYFSKILFLNPLNLKNILIVCTDYHLKRVKYLAKKVLGNDYKLNFKSRPSESSEDKEFMKTQDAILDNQKKFLVSMKEGEDSFLKSKLYSDPYYQSRRPEKSAQAAMRGVK